MKGEFSAFFRTFPKQDPMGPKEGIENMFDTVESQKDQDPQL